MTIAEMHNEFKVGVDKATSFNSPSLLPEEIDIFLNNAIEKFVHQRMYGNNPRKEGFEEDQKRWDDLINLVSTQLYTTFTTSPLTKPNGHLVNFPSDYWHTIQEDAVISYTDCNGNTQTKTVPVVPITHNRYNKVIRDPFHKPNENKVIRLGLAGTPEIIIGTGTTLTRYDLRYIKQPDAVRYGSTYAVPVTPDIDCNLQASTHKEIVKMAVTEALGNIESVRTPISTQELQSIE